MDRIVRWALVVAAGCALTVAQPASAGTLFRQSEAQFNFNAEPGETNQIGITAGSTPGRFVFTDLLQPVMLGEGTEECTGGGTNTVSCPLVNRVFVNAGDGNDGITVQDTIPMTFSLRGEGGDDLMDGGGLDDFVDGGDGDDEVEGDGGNDRLLPNLGADTVVDGGDGSDTVDYDDDRSTGVTVNLTMGVGAENDPLTSIENVTGSFFDDNLTGSPGDNVIRGNPGADTLSDGGGGNDILSYAGHGAAVTVNLATATPADGDTITGQWEGVVGSPFDDQLLAAGVGFAVSLDGRQGNDRLVGGSLADAIIGHEGADTLVGGLGADLVYGNTTSGTPDGASDTVSYDDGRTTSVLTELAGGHQDGDFYSDIQNLTGGDGNDLLVGDIGPNVLIGNNGADILVGADGVDDLRGGLPNGNADVSIDVASYRDRGLPVVAVLGGANPDGDLFSDISGLEGGGAGDTLTGDALANLLLGGAGNDTLTGGAGADDLQAGEGEDNLQARDGERDTVNCGAGTDTHDEDAIDVLTDCEDVLAIVPRPPAQVRRCVVPNVKRRTVAKARRLLVAKQCRLGKIRRVYSRKVRKGWIVSQSRRPGARLQRNAKVNLVVSRGKRRR